MEAQRTILPAGYRRVALLDISALLAEVIVPVHELAHATGKLIYVRYAYRWDSVNRRVVKYELSTCGVPYLVPQSIYDKFYSWNSAAHTTTASWSTSEARNR